MAMCSSMRRVLAGVAVTWTLFAAASIADAQQAPRSPHPDSIHSAAIGGTVRATNGMPLVGAVVRSWSVVATAVGDDSGRFLLKGLPAGSTHFTVQRVGYAPLGFDTDL